MTDEEAKLILHAHRPGGQDANDPDVNAALEHVRTRPELLNWFEQQQQSDAALSRKLKQVAAPEGLLESLVPPQPAAAPGWPPLAAAAAIAFLLVGSLWWASQNKNRPLEFAALRREMAHQLVQFPNLDLEAERWAELEQWLSTDPAWAQARIPAALQRFPGIGCRNLEWRGAKLGLVCFSVQGEVLHVLLIPPSALPELSLPLQQPEMLSVGRWNTAAWRDANLGYLVLTRASPSLLQTLIKHG